MKSPKKCFSCNKKLGIVLAFKCKCGNFFCSIHRYFNKHECTYDWKKAEREILEKNNQICANDIFDKGGGTRI